MNLIHSYLPSLPSLNQNLLGQPLRPHQHQSATILRGQKRHKCQQHDANRALPQAPRGWAQGAREPAVCPATPSQKAKKLMGIWGYSAPMASLRRCRSVQFRHTTSDCCLAIPKPVASRCCSPRIAAHNGQRKTYST